MAPPRSSPRSARKLARVIGELHRSQEFGKFLGTIGANVPPELDVAHSALAPQASTLSRALHAHLGQLAELGGTLVRGAHRKTNLQGSFRSTSEWETAIRGLLDQHNSQLKPFLWTKSADDILDSIDRYCRQINGLRTPIRLSRNSEILTRPL